MAFGSNRSTTIPTRAHKSVVLHEAYANEFIYLIHTRHLDESWSPGYKYISTSSSCIARLGALPPAAAAH